MAESRKEGRLRRHKRIRKTVTGTPERLRLSVFRSLNHIYAQIVDDLKGHTLVNWPTACGPMNSRSEMMKAWDGPGEQGREAAGEGREAKRVAGVGGMKREAGGSGDKGELK